MLFTLVHEVTVTMAGQEHGKSFRRTYQLPCAPQNGLRISLGADASFEVEDLVYHADARTFSCRTTVEASSEHPLDDVLSYYGELGYEVAR